MAFYLADGFDNLKLHGMIPVSDAPAKMIELQSAPGIVRIQIWEPGQDPFENWVLSFGVWNRI